jgi:hypothetical protein
MPDSDPRTGPRHEPERVYERAADPAEAANRPLEPKSPHDELLETDGPADPTDREHDPHHMLNNPVGEPDPDADSDPYRAATAEDDDDHASGTRGSGQGAEDR